MSQKKQKKQIPPPPDANASWEEQAAYFEQYGKEELEQAGHLQPLNDEDKKFVEAVRQEAARHIVISRIQ